MVSCEKSVGTAMPNDYYVENDKLFQSLVFRVFYEKPCNQRAVSGQNV